MAGNSHRHTKLKKYTKRRPSRRSGFRLWYIIPIAALLAFIVALILGNLLGEIASDTGKSESTPSGSGVTLPEAQGSVSINASHVTLKGIYDNTAAEVRAQIPSGAEAVAMTLFDENGDPYYLSPTAASFGNKCGELTLKNVFRPISERGLYSTVLFPSSLLTNDDELKNAVIGAYEATLVSELYSAGANEIVVHFSSLGESDPVITEGFLSLMTDYVSAIRAGSDKLRIGITLTPADLKNRSNAAVVEGLCKLADVCALDLTSIESGDELTSTLLELSPDLLRHEMRLILTRDGKSEEFITAAEEVISRLGIVNVQYVG